MSINDESTNCKEIRGQGLRVHLTWDSGTKKYQNMSEVIKYDP